MGNNSIEQERKKKKNASKNNSVQGNPKLTQPDRPGT